MKISPNLFQWIPRIICVFAILFISIFAADAFAPGLSFWQQIGDFLLHLIPSSILLALLIVAWKRELLGGILFTLIGIGFTPFIFQHNYAMNHSVSISLSVILMITFPFILVGVLFIVSHFKKKKANEINK